MRQSKRIEIFSWCLYDFANSSFATIILTVGFSVYFKESLCTGGSRGDFLWGLSTSLAYLAVAIAAPLLGAFSDQTGTRKKLFIGMTFLCLAATASLSILKPGQVAAGMILFILGFFGFATANVFYNAFLPEISTPGNVGRISGLGWGLGYVGGLASLLLFYPWISKNQFQTSFWLTAIFFLVFALPAFVFLRRPSAPSREPALASIKKSLGRLAQTRRQISQYRELLKFLIAFFFYNDGLSTVIVFSSLYARETFHMTMKEIAFLFISLQFTSLLGAFASGLCVDRFGAKKTILGTLAIWVLACLGVYLALDKTSFWAISLFAGLGIGSCQAASRAFVSMATPPSKSGEFFGFFAIFAKFSSILGPFIFGLVSHLMGSQRQAILSTLIFFLIGAVLLIKVKDERRA